IALNRKEQELARKQFEMQTTTLKYQRFEATYFNMLTLHHELVRSVGGSKAILHFMNERTYFRPNSAFDELRSYYNSSSQGDSSLCTKVHDNYGQLINSFNGILEYIFSMKDEADSREKYAKIFAAQLSSIEKILIFYHLNLAFEERSEDY